MIPDLRSSDRKLQVKAAHTLAGGVAKLYPGEPGASPVFGSVVDDTGADESPMGADELEDFLESFAEDGGVPTFRGPLTNVVLRRALKALFAILAGAIL